jgi:hypothetical protein
MIVFLVTHGNAFTLQAVKAAAKDFSISTMRYDQFFAAKTLPHATYVFTALDLLANWEVRVAASMYRHLQSQNLRVLNDPARVLSRYGLLRQLHRSGLNRFNAYRVEEGPEPKRWPVFLRTEGDHDGPLNPLLNDRSELDAAIAGALSRGIPLSVLLVTEYMAQPVQPRCYT